MTSSILKFLVDVGVGNHTENLLSEYKIDFISVRSINPRMPDHEIIKLAVSDNRIIITMDKDFGELVYHLEKKHAGVILLRLDDASGSEKARVVKYILENYSADLPGSFCVYQNEKFRIRKIKA